MRDARAFFRRVDVQIGLVIGAAISLLLLAVVTTLFFVATHDAIEVLDRELGADLRRIAAAVASREGTQQRELAVESGTVFRLVDANGIPHDLSGPWPRAGRLWPHHTSSLRLSFAAREDRLVRALRVANGAHIEAATSLEDFVDESREHLGQIAVSLLLGILGTIAVASFATRRALAPLRKATLAVENIDERSLDARLALRGSADDMDRHAIALNRVLERLEQSFQRISAFSADVAHELRTPVNRVLNLVDVAFLTQNGAAPEQQVVAIRESMEEMRRLIERLLLLSKGEAGRLPLHRERVDLANLGTDLVELFRPTCEQNHVALEIDAPGGFAIASVDAGLLQQAVANLLDNAVSHTPAGGAIRVDITADEKTATIAVSDTGAGVPERDRERIFDRFVQLDGSRNRAGAGLGLAISRMIARLHGGDLAVGASLLDGARFALRIPLEASRPTPSGLPLSEPTARDETVMMRSSA
jgi:signal transduction histidine kinase